MKNEIKLKFNIKVFVIFILLVNIGAWAASLDQTLKYGIALRDSGKIDEAILKFEEVLKAKPNHAKANYELGQTYLEKYDAERALPCFKKALQFGFDQVRSRIGLGLANMMAGNFTEAVTEFRVVLEAQPNNIEIHTYLGEAAFKSGSAGLAQEEYKKALKIDSLYIPALLGLANLYQSKRQSSEALALYEKAKAANPNYGPTYLNFATFYSSQKKYDTSIVYLNKYIELEPKNPKGYVALANVHSQIKDYISAINEMKQALVLGDSSLSSLKFLSYLYNQIKQPQEAKEISKLAVARFPDDIGSWIDLGKAYADYSNAFKVDSFLGTVNAYNRAVSIDTNYLPIIAFDFGLALYQTARYDSAVMMFTKKLQLDTMAAGAYFNRALAYIQLKKYKPEAIEDLKKGLILRPKYAQGHLWLAQVYAFLNMKQEAKQEANKVLELDPKNKDAKNLLQELNKPPKKDYYDYYKDFYDE